MANPTDEELRKEDEQFFKFLEKRDSRTYPSSSEDNLLTKDLRQPKEDQNYQFTTSGNSTTAQQSDSENAQLERHSGGGKGLDEHS